MARDEEETIRRLSNEVFVLRRKNGELGKAALEAKGALASLTVSEKRCRRLFETAKDGILLVDSGTGAIIDVNQAMAELSGHPCEELKEKKLWEIPPFKGIDAGLIAFRELRTKERIQYDDLPFETKDGKRISVEFICSAHPIGDAKILQCSVRDVTGRKKIENELWKMESRYRALFRQAALGIAIMDLDGCIIDNNGHLERILGYSDKELRGACFTDYVFAEDVDSDRGLLQDLLAEKRDSYQTIKRFVRKDGRLCWSLISASLVRDVPGGARLILWAIDDITERKQAEESLGQSEERFRQLAENIQEVFWISSPDYSTVLYVSPAYEEIWGRTSAGLYEDPYSWIEAVHPEDRARVEQSLKTDERYEAEFRIVRPDGAVRWIHDRGFPLKDASGQAYRIVGIAADITGRKLAEEALRESEEKIRLLLDSAGEAIYGIDTQGACMFCNPSCIRMLGYTQQDELIGKNMHKLIHHSRKDGTPYPAEECRLMRAVFHGEGVHFDDEILWRADGSSFPAEVISFPQQRNGSVVGAVVAFTDITERKKTEEALRTSEARFHDLAELLPQGVYEADVNGRVTYANRQAFEAFGYSADEVEAGLQLLQTVVPADRPRVHEAVARILAGMSGGGKEYTALRKDGTTFPVLIFSAPIFIDGRAQGLRGVFIDLTERKRAEEALARSEATLRSFYESAPVMMGVIELTDEGELIHIYDNPATARFFSVPYEDTKNKPAGALGAPEEAIREWVARYRQSRRENRTVRFEYVHHSPSGPLWLSATVSSIGPGSAPGRWRYSYIAEDVSERKRVEEEVRLANELLKIQATTDVLTGIYNRLKFTDFLEQEIREARRYRHPLSLIMFDVDHFKQINDTYGHAVGDDVLRELARLVSEHIRHADIFARWGGEEFMILAPHSETESTRQLADKMRTLIERQRCPSCPVPVTCSFGVTRFLDSDTVETFTNRADSALYRAKNNGRNRVEVIDDRELDGHERQGPPQSFKISA